MTISPVSTMSRLFPPIKGRVGAIVGSLVGDADGSIEGVVDGLSVDGSKVGFSVVGSREGNCHRNQTYK